MTNEWFIDNDWPTHLVNPEILFTDEGQEQAERLHNARIRESTHAANMITRGPNGATIAAGG